MYKRINCIFTDRGAYCTNPQVKRSLCGIGARCCSEFYDDKKCPHKVENDRPCPPPAAPKPRCDSCRNGFNGKNGNGYQPCSCATQLNELIIKPTGGIANVR